MLIRVSWCDGERRGDGSRALGQIAALHCAGESVHQAAAPGVFPAAAGVQGVELPGERPGISGGDLQGFRDSGALLRTRHGGPERQAAWAAGARRAHRALDVDAPPERQRVLVRGGDHGLERPREQERRGAARLQPPHPLLILSPSPDRTNPPASSLQRHERGHFR